MVIANNKKALSASGWKYNKPHTKEERKALISNFGKKCFLKPDELKYPVCDRNGNFDCKGIIASKFWADVSEIKASKRLEKLNKREKNFTRKKRPYSFKKISKKAIKLGKKLGCKKFSKKNKRI
tara:strand:+ start:24016 stop:24387 length:372 start_codon:yes stop_codon:yes gene_type:complete